MSQRLMVRSTAGCAKGDAQAVKQRPAEVESGRSARPIRIRPAAGRAARGQGALADHTSWEQQGRFGGRLQM